MQTDYIWNAKLPLSLQLYFGYIVHIKSLLYTLCVINLIFHQDGKTATDIAEEKGRTFVYQELLMVRYKTYYRAVGSKFGLVRRGKA